MVGKDPLTLQDVDRMLWLMFALYALAVTGYILSN